MYYKSIHLLLVFMFISTGCAMKIASESTSTPAADFVTATLPPTAVPRATPSSIPPSSVPTVPPIEGTTTTQVNVRAQTSTASETLGIIGQFTKVQVIGKDASGSWYQIVYADAVTGYGWVRAEYVLVDPTAKVPVAGSSAGIGSGVSGLVMQKINVRAGPATTDTSLGTLNPKDVVFITGKDPSGAWMRIEFVNAPQGFGWVALEFLQVDSVDSVPVIDQVEQSTASPANAASLPGAVIIPAMQDGDSMQTPLASAVFSPSGARAIQVNGDVSAPDGDREDWIQFTSSGESLLIQLICSSHTLKGELWDNTAIKNDFILACGEKLPVKIVPDHKYSLRLSEADASQLQYTPYTLKLEVLH